MKELGEMLKIFSDKNINDFENAQAIINIIHLSCRLEKDVLDMLLQSTNTNYLIITCSGYGGTRFEPDHPSNDYVFATLRYLVMKGFPAHNLRVRISPVFCNEKGYRALENLLQGLRKTGIFKIQICNLRQTNRNVYNVSRDFGKNIKEYGKETLTEKLAKLAAGFSVFYCKESCEFCINPRELNELQGCLFPTRALQDCGNLKVSTDLECGGLKYYRR